MASRNSVSETLTEQHVPQAQSPVAETYEQYNNPYRGVENHGVALEDEHVDTEDATGYDDHPPQVELYEDDYPQPVPVFIVESGAKERKRWRAVQHGVGTVPIQIASQRENRTRILIRNLSAGEVYIGDDYHIARVDSGWTLLAGDDVELFTDGAVCASAETGIAAVAVLEEFNVVTENGDS